MPAVSSRIFQANKNKELKRPINLKGLAVGNGLTVPSIQVRSQPRCWGTRGGCAAC